MRNKRNEFYIGMVDNYTVSQKYKKRKRRNRAKSIIFRVLVIALCVIVVGGIGTGIFFLAPIVSGYISSIVNATPDETEPSTEATVDETVAVTEVVPQTTVPVTTVPITTAPFEPDSTFVFNKPDIADDGTDGVLYSSTMYIWNNKGFNLFSSGEKVAKNYASAVNLMQTKLGKNITVYNMVVPNQTEYGLPQRIVNSGIETTSQADNIRCIYENLNNSVRPINCYNELSAHCNEYIYYGTDHHWTSLGAYYAYVSFCSELGLEPMTISSDKCTEVNGFTGSFCKSTGSSDLYAHPDTVCMYELPNSTYAYMRERTSSDLITVGVYYPATAGELTYGAFCWGDVAQFIIHSDCNTGRKIAVVKDSYGNAFAPYLTANYEEVHLIDYRYWSGDLKSYLQSNGITEVLILNNTMSANTPTQVNMMKDLVG